MIALALLLSLAAAQAAPPADLPPRRGEARGSAAPPPPPGGNGGPPPAMPSIAETRYAALVTVDDGVLRDAIAEARPAATATGATGLRLRSDEPNRNGVLVRGGRSAFTLADSRLTLSGMGTSDFLGIGAGAMAAGSVVVLRDADIEMRGAVRSALVAADGATVKVYGSRLVAHGGALPAGYVRKIGPGMMEAPAPLGIAGTARTSLTMGRSESYFYDTTLLADGWGALSTDATGGYVYVEANDCTIRVANSGYGAYADFGAHVVVNRGTLDAATFGAIIAGNGEVRLTGVASTAGQHAVMIHSVMGSPDEVARLDVRGGTVASGAAAILVKSANAAVTLDGADVRPGDGTLLRTVVNADPNRTVIGAATPPGVTLVLRGGAYRGDVVRDDMERPLRLTIDGARLVGAIRGEAVVRIAGDGRWRASAASRIRVEDAATLDRIDAPRGVVVAVAGTQLAGRRALPGGGTLEAAR